MPTGTTDLGPCDCCGGTSPECPCGNLPNTLHVTFAGWGCDCLTGTGPTVALTRAAANTCWTYQDDACPPHDTDQPIACPHGFQIILCCGNDSGLVCGTVVNPDEFSLVIAWCVPACTSGPSDCVVSWYAKAKIVGGNTCLPINIVFTGFTACQSNCGCGGDPNFIIANFACTGSGGAAPTSATVTS